MTLVRSRQGKMVLVVAAALVSALVSSTSFAQSAKSPQKIVTIEGITEYRLDNGLRVLLFPDQSVAKVTVNLTVFVGSRHEGYGETGMAHLLEHMVFKGTPTHRDIPKALKEHGASFNGTTWVDRTNYFETMPASDKNLEFAIRLEADRMVNSLILREDLASEMTVVRNEFEAGENSPTNILSQRMAAVAYEWHNYGKATIGNRSDIERVPVDRLREFYRKYYQPDNAMLIIAGKFETEKALAYVAKYFGAIPKPKRRLEKTYTEEPPQDGEREVVLRRVGKIGVVGAVYHIPAGSHPDFAPIQVLNHILTSEPSGRLYKALVETKKASQITGIAYSFHDPGIIEFQAQVDPKKDLRKVRDEMVELLESLGQTEFTQDEVERAKRSFLSARERLMTDSNRIGIRLSEWGALGDWRLFFLHRDRLKKVTPSDVARVARKYFVQSNRTVGLFIPTPEPIRAEIPPPPDVEQLVADYKGGEAIAQGEFFDPTPENIEKRTERLTLPSGVKVALLPKKTRGQAVVARLTLRFGNEKSLTGKTEAAQFLGDMLLRGTKQRSRQEIQDTLDKLGARLLAASDVGELTFVMQCKRDNLPPLLDLLGEILREPAFPEKEFDILKREQRDQLAKSLVEPSALAFREFRRRLNPFPKDDIRYVPTIAESIDRLESLTIDDVRKLYEEQLTGKVGEFVVVGDFDKEALLDRMGKYLASLKGTVPYARIARPARTDVKGSRHRIVTPDKKNAFYVAGHALPLTDTDADYPALVIADFLFGSGSLSSRLGNRVRQKEGLSYGVRSMFQASSQDKSAVFLMYAICNPNVIDKVDAAIADELQKLLKDGVGDEELEKSIHSYLEAQKNRRANDAELARMLANHLHLGRTFSHQLELEKLIAGLQPKQVHEAVRRHISPKKLIVVHAGDFRKQEENKSKGKE
ncbi:MAG: peptidase M16 [Gemmatales bacterium]|nr:MAG: peptidase M16 [Gemmatales bacterium]